MVESEFLKKFRAKFVGSDQENPPWPRETVNTALEYANEFVAVFRSLFMLLEHDDVPLTGPAKSARQMVKDLIDETHWPNGESIPVPAPWKVNRARAFRRYEIGAAINISWRRTTRRVRAAIRAVIRRSARARRQTAAGPGGS